MSATREERPASARQSTFVWAIGLLAGMIVACVGWSFAAYQTASDAEKKVLELEIRLNKADSNLDTRLALIEKDTKAIIDALQKHSAETSEATGSRKNRRDLEETSQHQLRRPESQ